jgi:hypothetical protein
MTGLSTDRATIEGLPPAKRRHVRRDIERRSTMATLSEKKRDSMPDSKFGLPDEHKYPMPDKSHAANAKARASQQHDKGNLSAADEKKIDRKADKILNK